MSVNEGLNIRTIETIDEIDIRDMLLDFLLKNIKIILLIQATGEDLGPFVTMFRDKDEETNHIEDDAEETDELARQPRVIGTASRYACNTFVDIG
jgi:hypothetical protein